MGSIGDKPQLGSFNTTIGDDFECGGIDPPLSIRVEALEEKIEDEERRMKNANANANANMNANVNVNANANANVARK